MASVLSIDLRGDTPRAVLLKKSGDSVSSVSSYAYQGSANGYRNELLAGKAGPEESEQEVIEPGRVVSLKELRKEISEHWDDLVVIAPTREFFSLDIDLPFEDTRSVDRVLDLEVQDLVPFDVSEFLIQHSHLYTKDDGSHLFHISGIPKNDLSNLLEACKLEGLEPRIVTTPSSALGGIYSLAREQFADTSLLVAVDDMNCYLLLIQNGQPRRERIIPFNDLERSGEMPLTAAEVAELKLSIVSFEEDLGCRLDKVYVVGSNKLAHQLKQSLGRSVDEISVKEFFPTLSDEFELAALGGLYGAELSSTARPLTNFRAREFRYSLQWDEVFRGLKSISSYVIAAICALVFLLGGKYLATEYRIHSIEESIQSSIREVAPQIADKGGSPLMNLVGARAQLERSMQSFSSNSPVAPLESLVAISRDFPRRNSAEVKSFLARGNKITLKLEADGWETVEKIDKLLTRKTRDKKRVYCKIDKPVLSPGRTYGRKTSSYVFKLELCE